MVGYRVSEVICINCCKRWIAVRPIETLLKELECPNCGDGYVIETGQVFDEETISEVFETIPSDEDIENEILLNDRIFAVRKNKE